MISIIWFSMLVLSTAWGILTHSSSEVSSAVTEGASSAVELLFSLAGPMCLWCGVSELLRRSGLRNALAVTLSPILRRLYPNLQKNRDGFSALSANVTANLLGLGNAATPMGITACQAMNDGTGIATNEQCRLVVMNTASIQLIPTTVAALRGSLGCISPLDILVPVLLTSLCSVSAGLLACRLLERTGHGR